MLGLDTIKSRFNFNQSTAIVPRLAAYVPRALPFVFGLLLSCAQITGGISPFGMPALVVGILRGYSASLLTVGCCLGALIIGRIEIAIAYAIAATALYGLKRFDVSIPKWLAYAICATLLFISQILRSQLVYYMIAASIGSLMVFGLAWAFDGAVDGIKNPSRLIGAEEVIAVVALLGSAFLGFSQVAIAGARPAYALAAALMLLISYCGGAGLGCACGVALGAMLAIAEPGADYLIGLFGLCALLAGAFRGLGQFGVLGAFLMGLFWRVWQSGLVPAQMPFIESALGGAMFLLLPKKITRSLISRLDARKYAEDSAKAAASRLRALASTRFSRLLPVFQSLGSAFSGRQKQPDDPRSVCSGCINENLCYGSYASETGRIFSLIQDGEAPEDFMRDCPRAQRLSAQLKYDRAHKECAGTIAGQMDSISAMLEGVSESLKRDFLPCPEMADDVSRALSKSGIEARDVSVVTEAGIKKVYLNARACGGDRACECEIASAVSGAMGQSMRTSNYGCVGSGGTCQLCFEPVENLSIVAGISRRAPGGERACGDSYAFGRLDGGKFYCVLSDGMGSGKEAAELSRRTVEMVEDYLAAGLPPELAAETANRYLACVTGGQERFSTLDIICLSLFTGEMQAVKVSACKSFILSGGEVRAVGGSSLPLGIFTDLKPAATPEKLEKGDIYVMMSDGIGDCGDGADGWIIDVLRRAGRHNPQAAAEAILSAAESMPGAKPDDRTVLVLRVC